MLEVARRLAKGDPPDWLGRVDIHRIKTMKLATATNDA
jgi:hypothetical protein